MQNAQFTRTVDADFNPLCGRCGKALYLPTAVGIWLVRLPQTTELSIDLHWRINLYTVLCAVNFRMMKKVSDYINNHLWLINH